MELRKRLGAIAFAVATFAALPAVADTLADIKERGTIIVAVDVSHPPYGMLDSSAKETGSDVETAQLLAEDLGVQLQLVPVSGANRVPFLLANKVDVVIASFSITEERKKVIDYSRPYGVIPVVVSAPEAEEITEAGDLAGKAIAVARGTTADIELTRIVKDSGARANIVRYEDEATANTAVATGQQKLLAAALSTANSVSEQNPGLGLEVKIDMAAYPMAVGLRKNDPELKVALDEWVLANLQNGKLNTIYEKYFHQALPADLAN
ncbi:transporter substrate-binding domain-containing protein [Falsirhodobacter sp. 20TX0035]|uniref:transporter substrate-binding domain-containing protein n=1 Tax=Falsirhodobacter sp. 20TX0035 TaxID=3022019 RepID=UPI00232E738A|nr:transporter substrate-binding domain-containing protein [Falsirhodobacter sp. 20TX0035]MDB6454158.1 transporter substrate-binding domain-containing protein [Falsirhodobacter sp. 20TX0035]